MWKICYLLFSRSRSSKWLDKSESLERRRRRETFRIPFRSRVEKEISSSVGHGFILFKKIPFECIIKSNGWIGDRAKGIGQSLFFVTRLMGNCEFTSIEGWGRNIIVWWSNRGGAGFEGVRQMHYSRFQEISRVFEPLYKREVSEVTIPLYSRIFKGV